MTDAPHHHADALKYEDWAGEMGARWLANLTGFENTIAPAGEALLAHADYQPGERVVDIGFGGGATSLAIAQAVAPDGEVVGIDISPDLAAATTRRAAAAGIANARFICADAATVSVPDAPFDRLCSRFGSMFFSEPVPAFANMRGLLKPGGRLDLAVWGPPLQNPWMLEGMAVARRHVEMPAPVPRAPGPFAFEEREYMEETLVAAGFSNVNIVAAKGELPVGGPGATAEQAQAFVRHALAFGQALLDHLKAHYPQLAQNLSPTGYTLPRVAALCKALLIERVPLRDFRKIAEAMVSLIGQQLSDGDLIEAVRQRIGALIVQTIVPSRMPLPVVTFSPDIEMLLNQSVRANPGAEWPFEHGMAMKIIGEIGQAVEPLLLQTRSFALVVSPLCRAALSRLVRATFPDVAVISYLEIPAAKQTEIVATIGGELPRLATGPEAQMEDQPHED